MGIQVFTDRTLRERDREKDARITELEADNIRLEAQVARLTEQSTKLAEENDHLNVTWKMNYELLLERVGKAEQEAEEREKAIQAIRLTLAELLPFLRNLKRGNFRSDRGNTDRFEALRALVAKYDKANEA
jgi:hypothetical protein